MSAIRGMIIWIPVMLLLFWTPLGIWYVKTHQPVMTKYTVMADNPSYNQWLADIKGDL